MRAPSRPPRCVVFGVALLLAGAAAQAAQGDQSTDAMVKTGKIFSGNGVQPGEPMPDFVLTRLDGTEVHLSELWSDRPALLVTGSLTCPTARSRHPAVEEVAASFGDRIHVAYIYTVEAHPKKDPSPYGKYRAEHLRSQGIDVPEGEAGWVWESPENEELGLSRRQPTDFETRQSLAREFDEHLDVSVPILVDGMDNAAWEAMGGGPNLGVLVRPDGVVEVKHGWFHGPSMKESIDWLLERRSRGESSRGESQPQDP